MEKSILVVDDDKEIVRLIEITLASEGYKIFKANDGIEALNIFTSEDVGLIVLDIMMPNLDGIGVCKKIRESSNIPILMLSAKSEDIDKIEGIITGADDYLTKPFNSLELVVRIKALIRRAYNMNLKKVNKKELIKVGPLSIDKYSRKVRVEDKEISFTSTEFEILYLLARNIGRVFSAEEIFERVWKEKYYNSNNTVMVHVSRIRDKIEDNTNGEKLIHTVWGVGYKIEG